MLPLPVSIIALEGINLELLERSGLFQIQELVLDPFGKTTIEFTVKCYVVPPSIGGMLGEFNQIFVDVVVFLHFEGSEGMFRCLGEVWLSEKFIKLGNEFGPVAADGWFRVSHKIRVPPQ